jgi:capsid protein
MAANTTGYNANYPKTKRRNPGTTVRTVDASVSDQDKRQLIESARDLYRNFPVAAWAIRKHLDYVSTFNFMIQTGNKEFDDTFRALLEENSRPENCDITGRHSLGQLIRLAEGLRTTDGDVFLMKLRSGHLQGIEADRVRNEYDGKVMSPEDYRAKPWLKPFRGQVVSPWATHGVVQNKAGKAIGYRLWHKTIDDRYVFEKVVPARNMIHFGYFDKMTQARGYSPLIAAIDTMHDVDEMSEFARLKAKVSQYFALSISRDKTDYLTGNDAYDEECSSEGQFDSIDFGTGPLVLDLEDGDRADFLESKTPSTEFQDYITLALQMGLKALDIPWSIADESFTNYSGSRIAMTQYIKSCDSKRDDVVRVLNSITEFWFLRWIKERKIKLPAGMEFRDIKWRWVPAGVPWFDPKAEAQADIELIAAGLKTRSEVRLTHFGDDWKTQVADKLKEEEDYLKELGLKQEAPVDEKPGDEEENPEEESDDEDGDDEDQDQRADEVQRPRPGRGKQD